MTALWPAIVAAFAALAGVLAGQLLQGRRDRIAYEREVAREDRNRERDATVRFVEDRLQVFSRFLQEFNGLYEMWNEESRLRDENSVPESAPLPREILDDFEKRLDEQEKRLDAQRFVFELLASRELARQAENFYTGMYDHIIDEARATRRPLEQRGNPHLERETLIAAMQAELADTGSVRGRHQ